MASNLSELCVLSDDGDDDEDEGDEGDGSSEEESSGSSGEDEESEEEDDDDESQDEVIHDENRNNVESKVHSSEDDPERECCPVCLNKFIGQDLGTPESCEHTFCFECIKEWSKNINTCPIDRTEFNFIHMRAVPGGSILRKVKVKVQPKEAEEALQESVTVCEVCHSGNREDRLLLCDGCDLAYHCECLDPPLFYIPIEEWFCPPCSGVLRNRAVAGPSSSRRRVIPRTRASETVRTRVQNLRTGGSSAPRSTSRPRKTNSTKRPRKKKRRTYRKAYKKVVKLARTKKDMNDAFKSKVGARGTTVIVTYRRRRKKRRISRRKLSRKSLASAKALPVPSAKQRIAKHLGISKPQGSSVPQVKQSARSRSASRISRMPTHSLFGNRNQLMDFDENFNENLSNLPSTSSAASPQRRPSSDSFSSSISGINLLDSIMAGQKLLHSKSDNIVIKNDGTLILKEASSASKSLDNVRKIESDQSRRTPMSAALVKTGVKGLTSLTDKNLASVSASTSKAKIVTGNKTSKPSKEKSVPKSNSLNHHWISKSNCSNSKSYSESLNNIKMSKAKECYRKSSASIFTIPKKRQEISNTKKRSTDDERDTDTLIGELGSDVLSDWESELSNKVQADISDKIAKKRVNSNLEVESSSSNSTFSCFQTYKSTQGLSCSDVANTSVQASKTLIKKEVLSDDETDTGTISSNELANSIKKEVLSDEETNADTWREKGENRQQVVDVNGTISRIKAEPVDSDCRTDIIENYSLNIQKVSHNKFPRGSTYETESSDFEASQSIIDTAPNDILYSLLGTDLNSKIHPERKIKEEVPSDNEDFSQSLVSTADPDFVSQSISPYFSQSTQKSLCNKQSERFLNSCTDGKLKKGVYRKNIDTSVPSKSSSPVNVLPSTHSENENPPSTEIAHSPVVIDSSSDDEDMPCTQAAQSPAIIHSSCEDEDMPCTQAAQSPAIIHSSSEDEDMPYTQVVSSPTSIEDTSNDDLPCTQAVSVSRKNMADDVNLPCTQAVTVSESDSSDDNDDDDDNLPCTHAVSVSRKNLSEDNLPCTQVVPPSVARRNLAEDNLPFTEAASVSVSANNLLEDDDLPCTQAISLSLSRPDLPEEDSLPCTQAASFPVRNSKTNCDFTSNNICNQNNSLLEIPNEKPHLTHFVPKGVKAVNVYDEVLASQVSKLSRTKSKGSVKGCFDQCSDVEMPPTQVNFEFLKPAAVSDKPITSREKNRSFKNFPTTITSRTTSTTDDELLPTQCLESSKSLNKRSFSNDLPNIQEDLPPTQVFRAYPKSIDLPETQSVAVMNESFDLPATQVSDAPSKRLSVPNECDATKGTDTEVMNNGLFDLPATQVFCGSLKEKNMNECQDTVVNDELFSLPTTQLFIPPSKSKDSLAELEADPDELFTLPATQISSVASKQTQLPGAGIDDADDESLSLPATQVSKDIKALDTPTKGNLRDVTIDQSSSRIANVPDTEDFESHSLPATQINTNFKDVSSVSSEGKTSSPDGKLMHNKDTCLDDRFEKTECSNMNDILSNIKHLVNSLSAKDPENSNCQKDENLLHRNDKNVSDDNLKNKTVESDLPDESTNTDDTLDGMNDCENSKKNDQENLSIDVNEGEKLSHEKLKEIASKSCHVVPTKNIGIHKHLPQVIDKLPVKEHIKLKPANRRTFSFEEVAKLEEPNKTLRNLSVDSIERISECDLYEDTPSDNDEFPPTQRVDFESLMNKSAENNKRIYNESHSNSAEVKSHSTHETELNFARSSPCAGIEDTDDFPATQLIECREKGGSSKPQPLISFLNSKLVGKAQSDIGNKSVESSAQQCIKKDSRLTSDSNEFILPATQISFSSENISGISTNKQEHSSSSDKNNLPVNKEKNSKNKSSVHIISVKSRVTTKHSKDKKSSNSVDMDDPSTIQVSSNILENKSSNISKYSIDRTTNSKCHQSNPSEICSVNSLSKKKSIAKTSVRHKLKDSTRDETEEPPLESDFDDLPATQVCSVSEKASRKALNHFSHETVHDKDNLSNACKQNKHVENMSSALNNKNNPFQSKKLSEAEESSNPTFCKQKSTFSDDVHRKKVKDHNLTSTPENRELPNVMNKQGKYNQKGSKRSHEGNVLGVIHKNDKNLSSKKLKQISSGKQNLYQSDERCMLQKDETNLLLPSDHRKVLLAEKVIHNSTVAKSVSDVTGKQQECNFHSSNGVVMVKQEKIDNGFKVPLTKTHESMDSSVSTDIDRKRIKTEDLSDLLPATQVASFNQTNGSTNSSIINSNLLPPTSIKREVCSDDDEISIIEPVFDKTKVKEEIFIDDDDDEVTISHTVEKNQPYCVIKSEGVPVPTEIDILSIKTEKCYENNEKVSSKPKPQTKSTKIFSKQTEKKDSKSSLSTKESKQKHDKGSAITKLADKSHKTVDKSRSSSLISKGDKLKKDRNEHLKSKSENTSQKHNTKNIERSKDSSDSLRDKRNEKKLDSDSLKSKSSSTNVKNNSKLSSIQSIQNPQEKSRVSTDKQRVRNSEKENSSSLKNNIINNDIIITLKPPKKRPHESSKSEDDPKRRKYDYLDSESCSSENSCNTIHLGSFKNSSSNVKLKKSFDIMDDRVSSSTPRSDISTGSVNTHYAKDSSTIPVPTDIKKILNKQDLKEEIANEVKLVLKPFFSTGLISKEEYKDIMRRAVPKIFMNCHNWINQEKIRKLVLSYVTMLNKS